MPWCGCPVKSCGQAGDCCTGCCRGAPCNASAAGWQPCCAVERSPTEVGVRMLRSATAPQATPQKERWFMIQAQPDSQCLLGRKQDRDRPPSVTEPRSVFATMRLRLFKG